MFRRYWLPAIALGLAVLTSGQAPNDQRISTPRPAVEKQATSAANSKHEPSVAAPLSVQIIQSTADAEHAQKREVKADKDQSENLNAQVRAADAAEKQITPSWIAAFLTFAGTVLLVWTLSETRNANRIAKEALDVSRQTDRPHMLVSGLKLKGFRDTGSDAVKVNYAAKNWGKSPAFLQSVALEASLFEKLPSGKPEYTDCTAVHHVLAEGGNIEFKGDGAPAIVLSYPERIAIIGQQKFLLVFGRIEYRDVHNIVHVNRWSYLFRPGTTDDGDTWSAEGEGIFTPYREYT